MANGLVYIDNVIFFLNPIKEPTDHIDITRSSFEKASVSLKNVKWKLMTVKDHYLGHSIRSGKLEIDYAHTLSHKSALLSADKWEFYSFPGLYFNYRRFVDNFTHSRFFPRWRRKNIPNYFNIYESQIQAFCDLINTIRLLPVFNIAQLELEWSVGRDALLYGLGCTLNHTNFEDDCWKTR